jgi:cysteine protease ATG4
MREMDPSMLIGFLIKDETDLKRWKASITSVQGKPVIRVLDKDRIPPTLKAERASAIDEVETLDTEDDLDEL